MSRSGQPRAGGSGADAPARITRSRAGPSSQVAAAQLPIRARTRRLTAQAETRQTPPPLPPSRSSLGALQAMTTTPPIPRSAIHGVSPRQERRSSVNVTPLQRLRVRESLGRSPVGELSVRRRLEMLAEIAGDYIAKMMTADSDTDDGEVEEERSWTGLVSLRENYVFDHSGPLFPSLENADEAFHPGALRHVPKEDLRNAVRLSTIATFLHVILQPDSAGDLLEGTEWDVDWLVDDRRPSELEMCVRRRNRVLTQAFAAFWQAMVPEDKRTDQVAIDLWLDFASQIAITYQCPTIEPPSSSDDRLPPIAPRLWRMLMDKKAYLQYAIGDDRSPAYREAAHYWMSAVEEREKEIHKLPNHPHLRRKYSYVDFAKRMRDYVATELVEVDVGFDTADTASVSDSDSDARTEDEVAAVVGMDIIDAPVDLDLLSELVGEMEDLPPQRKPVSLFGNPPRQPSFDWSARQKDATQVEWDSEPESTPRPRRAQKGPAIAEVDEESLLPSETQLRGFGEAEEEHDLYESQQTLEETVLPSESQLEGDGIDENTKIVLEYDSTPPSSSEDETDEDDVLPSETQLGGEDAKEDLSTDEDSEDELIPAASQLGYDTEGDDQTVNVDAETNAENETLMPSETQLEGDATIVQGTSFQVDEETVLPPESQLDGDLTVVAQETVLHVEEETIPPSESQLNGDQTLVAQSAQETREEETVLPLETQLLGDHQQNIPQNPSEVIEIADDAEVENLVEALSASEASPTRPPLPIPTSQRAFVRRSINRDELVAFATPEPEDLRPGERPTTALPESARHLHGPRRVARTPSPPLRSVSPNVLLPTVDFQIIDQPQDFSPFVRRAKRARPIPPPPPIKVDLYLVDDDGAPLEVDPYYVIPQGWLPMADHNSRLHGQRYDSGWKYARKSGVCRWALDEELLLYRTIQKIPMSEDYLTRVVWYFHGEYGQISERLADFNPQHMRSKMCTIVEARHNRGLSIVGNARYFLKKGHPARLEYDTEKLEYQRRLNAARRAEEEKRRRAEEAELAARQARLREPLFDSAESDDGDEYEYGQVESMRSFESEEESFGDLPLPADGFTSYDLEQAHVIELADDFEEDESFSAIEARFRQQQHATKRKRTSDEAQGPSKRPRFASPPESDSTAPTSEGELEEGLPSDPERLEPEPRPKRNNQPARRTQVVHARDPTRSTRAHPSEARGEQHPRSSKKGKERALPEEEDAEDQESPADDEEHGEEWTVPSDRRQTARRTPVSPRTPRKSRALLEAVVVETSAGSSLGISLGGVPDLEHADGEGENGEEGGEEGGEEVGEEPGEEAGEEAEGDEQDEHAPDSRVPKEEPDVPAPNPESQARINVEREIIRRKVMFGH